MSNYLYLTAFISLFVNFFQQNQVAALYPLINFFYQSDEIQSMLPLTLASFEILYPYY